MQRRYLWFGGLIIFTVAVLVAGVNTYAQDTPQIKNQFGYLHVGTYPLEFELYEQQPEASSLTDLLFYDDLEDHYEQMFLMCDQLDIVTP